MIAVRFTCDSMEQFDAWHFNYASDGSLELTTKSGDLLAVIAPGQWTYVVDLDPTGEEAQA